MGNGNLSILVKRSTKSTINSAFGVSDPEFGGYLCHRGTGDRFSGKLNTTSSLFRKDFQGFQYGGAIRLQDRSLLEEDRLMGELLPHRLIELDRFLSGFGRQGVFGIGSPISNDGGLHLPEFS